MIKKETIQECKNMFEKGFNLNEIHAKVGIHQSSVRKYLKQEGINTKKNHFNSIRKPLRNISVENIIYISGLFDGEGSINVHRSGDKKLWLQITITNTHYETLKWISNICGGTIRSSGGKKKYKPVFSWQASSWMAYSLLKIMLPYLKIKKEQALIAINYQELKIENPNRTDERLTKENKLKETLQSLR